VVEVVVVVVFGSLHVRPKKALATPREQDWLISVTIGYYRALSIDISHNRE